MPWASATDFAEAFSGEVQARIGLLALDYLGDFRAMSQEWNLPELAQLIEPEKMAPIIAELEAEWATSRPNFWRTKRTVCHREIIKAIISFLGSW